MYPPLCEEDVKSDHTCPPHGASLSPKRPRQDQGDPGAAAAMWEETGNVHTCPPTGRPYPPNGPGRTGGIRVYPPLCGGDGPSPDPFRLTPRGKRRWVSPLLPGCRGGALEGAPIHSPPIGTWGLEHRMGVDLLHTSSGTPISARISGPGKGASVVPGVC